MSETTSAEPSRSWRCTRRTPGCEEATAPLSSDVSLVPSLHPSQPPFLSSPVLEPPLTLPFLLPLPSPLPSPLPLHPELVSFYTFLP